MLSTETRKQNFLSCNSMKERQKILLLDTHTYYPVLHNAMTKTNCQDWFVCNKNVSEMARSCLIRAHSRCRARGCPGWTAAAWRGWAPGTAACGRGPRCSAGAGTATCPPSATRTQIYLCTWYTSVCRYFGQHNNNCSVTICLAASS